MCTAHCVLSLVCGPLTVSCLLCVDLSLCLVSCVWTSHCVLSLVCGPLTVSCLLCVDLSLCLVSCVWTAHCVLSLADCSLSDKHAADVVLVLDGFNNITSEDFSKVTRFLETLVQNLGVVGLGLVRFALVKCGVEPKIEFYLNTYNDVSSVVSAVKSLSQSPASPGDLTCNIVKLHKTIFPTDREDRIDAPDALIVISDRKSPDINRDAVEDLWHVAMKVFIVAVKEADYSKMNGIVNLDVVYVQNLNSLPNILIEFIQCFCRWIKQSLDVAPPESVTFSDVQSRRAQVSWTYSDRSVDRFNVFIPSESRQFFVLGHKRSTELLHLKPNTDYTIKITVYMQSVFGFPVIEHLTTPKGKVLFTPPPVSSLSLSLSPHTSPVLSSSLLLSSLQLCLCSSDSVRLSGGPGRCSGSPEVLVDHMWTSVCAEDFGHTEAEVLCRELDCGGVSELQGALSTEESAVRRSFHCRGTETALKDCESSETLCSTAANVTCTDDVALEIFGFHCRGFLMMRHEDQWRSVKTVDQDQDRDWTLDLLCVNSWAVIMSRSQNLVSSEAESESQGHRVLVRSGANFTVSCSLTEPFDLVDLILFSPTGNYTLRPINHSAHFLFSAIGPPTQELHLWLHDNIPNLNLKLVTLHIGPGEPNSHLILRAVIYHVVLITTALFLYCQSLLLSLVLLLSLDPPSVLRPSFCPSPSFCP
ncbi:hypothetical protein WMY93_010378 [Mugilogobius chulae]|uniref:von Willebrand factor A domain-containing protein 1 n=1 Tax=Mugilogobius chulae TaxID=88201 RepID=A0AAW0PAZ5_9GOBI